MTRIKPWPIATPRIILLTCMGTSAQNSKLKRDRIMVQTLHFTFLLRVTWMKYSLGRNVQTSTHLSCILSAWNKLQQHGLRTLVWSLERKPESSNTQKHTHTHTRCKHVHNLITFFWRVLDVCFILSSHCYDQLYLFCCLLTNNKQQTNNKNSVTIYKRIRSSVITKSPQDIVF